MPDYDRWLCDGPLDYCERCGQSVGRMHDTDDPPELCGPCETQVELEEEDRRGP